MHAQAQSIEDPRIGMVLQDRYRIVRKLGDGGMGTVYEGEHVSIKRRVAIKVLHQQFAQKPEIVARFHREAEAANAIGHPNIVEVTDMGRFPDGSAYMVLEFLDGRDWARDIEREGPQPLGKVVHIISQVCDALDAAHSKGIVHRDMKPENIFLIQRGGDRNFAKVVDFGISKIADPENPSLTQTGTALGTPYYMAPEQCQGKKDLDARADIYSLGVILFQALTRQYPFDDESYPMLVLKICTEPPPLLAHYRPDLPREVQDIVNCMLAKDRNYRFASCAEVRAALEPFRSLNDAPIVTTNAPSTASRGPSVLEARATGPVSTPSGTAFLPGQAPVPAPLASAPQTSSSGRLLPVIGILSALVLAGGALGAAAALGLFGGRHDVALPEVTTSPTELPEQPEERPGADVALVAPPPTPDVEPAPAPAPVPSTPPELSTVRVEIHVQGPTNAVIFIDGDSFGSAPVVVQRPREALTAPGQAPRLHTIEARASGWRASPLEVFYDADVTRTITMAPGTAAPRVVRPGPANPGPPAPTPMVVNPAPVTRPDPPPPPRGGGTLADPFQQGSVRRRETPMMGTGEIFR